MGKVLTPRRIVRRIPGPTRDSGNQTVPLFLTLVLVILTLFALFWGGGKLAQGYLYNEPADRLPLRSAVAGLVVGLFVILWVGIDKPAPGKYDTFFHFPPYHTP